MILETAVIHAEARRGQCIREDVPNTDFIYLVNAYFFLCFLCVSA